MPRMWLAASVSQRPASVFLAASLPSIVSTVVATRLAASLRAFSQCHAALDISSQVYSSFIGLNSGFIGFYSGFIGFYSGFTGFYSGFIGSTVVSQGSTVVSQGSILVSKGSTVVSQGSIVVS